MASATESSPSGSRVNNGLFECKPLLEAATKDLFRKNAFRITGLPVDATSRDLAKHAEKLKVLVELGQDPQPNAAFPLRPPPTVEDIREAIQKLKDPEKRLIDEFFWFWPDNFGQSRSDASIQALEKGDLEAAAVIWMSKRKHPTEGVVATHNLALIFHISALDWEKHCLGTEIDEKCREDVAGYWEAAFHRWKGVVTNEQLWEKVVMRIRQLNEPNLTTGFARRMRATLPAAFEKMNAELALAFAESGKLERARLHAEWMRAMNQGSAQAETVAEVVLTPIRKRLKEQVRQAKEHGEKHPRDAIAAARELLERGRDALVLFDLFFGKDSHFRNDVFDEVAEICNRLQVAYHKATNDNETCIEFLKVVLPFAASTDLRQQIEKNIGTLVENIEGARKDKALYGNLTPISSAPSLSTINGIGCTLYGSTDLDPDNGSCLATYYFVFFGIPIFPICRYRVIRNGNAYRFLGKAPLRKGDRWHLAISLGVILSSIIALSYVGSQSTPSNASAYTPRSSAPSSGVYTRPTFNSGNSSWQPNRQSLNLAQSALVREKAELESERATVQALDNNVENLGREIERERTYLDQTSQFEIDAFNAKVRRYSALLRQAQSAEAAFNARIDNYNAKVRAQ